MNIRIATWVKWLQIGLIFGAIACSEEERSIVPSPSDDPADYEVDTSVEYQVNVSDIRWVVEPGTLIGGIDPQASNNNVDIEFFDGRLFLGWRTGPSHFASNKTEMLVVSSADNGVTWDFEHRVFIGMDMREPRLLRYKNELQLLFFEAGENPVRFEPQRIWRSIRNSRGNWTDEIAVDEAEVPWDMKVRQGVVYMTSYIGGHYDTDAGPVDTLFKFSSDGRNWNLVDGVSHVYRGGVSEVAFEFDEVGDLWAVTRNEDGDETGYGSHVCYAKKDSIAEWECPSVSNPERYDSPEMFRHGHDIYLVARRDIGGPFGDDGGELAPYSLRPKTTAMYRIDRETRSVVHMMDLPGAGDTAFPAIRRTGPHSFLMANYTSPLDDPNISWLDGQISPDGTSIYLMDITFEPKP